MGIKIGFKNKNEIAKTLKEAIGNTYTLKNEKEINYGLQFEIYSGKEYIGIIKIFESKKGSHIDTDGIKDSAALKDIQGLLESTYYVPVAGENRLPKTYLLSNDKIIEGVRKIVYESNKDRLLEIPSKGFIYNLKLDGITVMQWPSGRLLIQGTPSSLSDNLIKNIDNVIESESIKSLFAFNKNKFSTKKYEKILEEIKKMGFEDNSIPKTVYDYLYPNDKIELVDALKILALVKEKPDYIENYASLVRNVSVVFEGFLIKLFIDLGLITESQLLVKEREIRIGKIINRQKGKSRFEETMGPIFSKINPHLGSKLESYWLEYRDRYLHSNPASPLFLETATAAETSINNLVNFMQELLAAFREKISFDIKSTDIDKLSCIGIDEAGKGDVFGPLVVASVFADKDMIQTLIKWGVKDSKELSENEIFRLNKLIRENCIFNVVEINPQRYNNLYTEIKNLNELLAWGHARTLENILVYARCNVAISDQFGNEELIKDALMNRGRSIELIQTPHGERNPAVAAASILARADFVSRIKEIGESINTTLPKGASNPAIPKILKDIVNKFGKDKLNEVAKLHFKTVRELSI